jgi:phenylacetaldehyde dehydrogenase
VAGAAGAIYSGAGQVCTAGSRLFVEAPIYAQVLERLSEHSRRLNVGPGFAAGAEIGPLISGKQLQRVQGYVDGAKADGVTVVTGGGRYDDEVRGRGYFFQPTILTGVNPRMKVVCEEVFGPVLTVMPFSTEEEAVALANETEYGLAGMCWTRDLARAHRLAQNIQCGMFWINCYSQYISTLPHGGLKMSGYGAKFGLQSITDHLEERSVVVQL